MWIYIPQSHCVRESGCSITELILPCLEDFARSSTWREKHSAVRTWLGRWKKDSWLRLLSGVTSTPSQIQGALASYRAFLSTSFSEESRASHGAVPARRLAAAMQEIYGPEHAKRLRSINRGSCSSRTFQDSLLSLTERSVSLKSWKDWVTRLRLDSSNRLKRAQVIRDSDASSWRSPQKANAKQGARNNASNQHEFETLVNQADKWPTGEGESTTWGTPGAGRHEGHPTVHTGRGSRLQDQAGQWPTTRKEDAESCGNHPNARDSLTGVTKDWPTPQAHDTKKRGNTEADHHHHDHDLSNASENWPTPGASDGEKAPKTFAGGNKSLPQASKDFPGTPHPKTTTPLGLLLQNWTLPECPRLSANFAEWLMGWPVGLTAFVLSETEWTHWSLLTHSSLCQLVSGEETVVR